MIIKSNLLSQVTFNKVYDDSLTLDASFSLICDDDSNFYLVGQNTNDVHIQKVDALGNIVFKRVFDYAPDFGIEKAVDGNIINNNLLVIGTLYDTIYNLADVFLIKLNLNGSLVWHKKINQSKSEFAQKIAVSDSAIYIAGYVDDSTFTQTDALLIKTDLNGNLKWIKTFGDTTLQVFYGVAIDLDGNVVLTGQSAPTTWLDPDIYLVKIDPNGNLIWEKHLNTGYADVGNDVIVNTNNEYVIAGTSNTPSGNANGYLLKTDKNGVKIWDKHISRGAGNMGFNAVHINKDGNYVMAGNTPDYNQMTTTSVGWMVLADTMGDTLWSKTYTHYGGTTQNVFLDVIPTFDGGFAACGYIINGALPQKNDMWLVKTDCMGNDSLWDTTACPLISTSLNDYAFNNEVSIYPNPASTSFTLAIDFAATFPLQLAISDLSGKLLQRIEVTQSNQKIDVSTLASGMYLYQLENNHLLATGKFVKQ